MLAMLHSDVSYSNTSNHELSSSHGVCANTVVFYVPNVQFSRETNWLNCRNCLLDQRHIHSTVALHRKSANNKKMWCMMRNFELLIPVSHTRVRGLLARVGDELVLCCTSCFCRNARPCEMSKQSEGNMS